MQRHYGGNNCFFLSQDGASWGHIKIGGSDFGLWTCVNHVVVVVVVVDNIVVFTENTSKVPA